MQNPVDRARKMERAVAQQEPVGTLLLEPELRLVLAEERRLEPAGEVEAVLGNEAVEPAGDRDVRPEVDVFRLNLNARVPLVPVAAAAVGDDGLRGLHLGMLTFIFPSAMRPIESALRFNQAVASGLASGPTVISTRPSGLNSG